MVTWFRSYRAQLIAAFLTLGVTAIGVTGWEASRSASDALRRATAERLTAIRETRARQIERYFDDLSNHVLALSSDESVIIALERFGEAWPKLPPEPAGAERPLRELYRRQNAESLFPADPRTRALQAAYLVANPHPPAERFLLLEAPGAGEYDAVHRRFHPTLHRYRGAFGFYDIFLIDAEGRVLYTVAKEIDLGVSLVRDEPYRATGLARIYERARRLSEPELTVIEDFSRYLGSNHSPAAFLAAPIWRAGEQAGVLAIQISLDEIDRVMTGERRWREEGLGETGQSYLIGRDGLLRSDLRRTIESPPGARRTGVLEPPPAPPAAMLRRESPAKVPGVEWRVVAEIEEQEALQPVRDLQRRMLVVALIIAAILGMVAWWLGGSITRRLRSLADNVQRIAGRDFRARVTVRGRDELAQLAIDFNRMAEDLERTTVSKDEFRELAGKLITAQEDERRRIARELHDDLTQRLAAVAIDAGNLEQRLPGEPALTRLKSQMAELSRDVHGLSRSLHPRTLDDLGLIAALEAETRSFFEHGGPPVEFSARGLFEDLPAAPRLAIYRIAQEALRNIAKHADADQVSVSLERDDREIRLEISDDGAGFARGGAEWQPGVGLASMEERARLLGGSFAISSRPGQGTHLSARIPLGRSS